MTNNPQNPNYKPSVGRLVTDRYDFEKHVNGSDFRHQASEVDINPLITIGGTQPTNVQDAVNQLNNAINAFVPTNATTTVFGTIKLSGDLSGSGTTAGAPKVSGLQGHPVATGPPSVGQILYWGGSIWSPQYLPLNGDVHGPSNSSKVIAITGIGAVPVNANLTLNANINMRNSFSMNALSGSTIDVLSGAILQVETGGVLYMVGTSASSGSRIRAYYGLNFDRFSEASIKQDPPTTDVGTGFMVIQAQSAYSGATGANKNGAFLTLTSGLAASGGTSGNICLITDNPGTPVNAVVATPTAVHLFPATNTPVTGAFSAVARAYYNWAPAPTQSLDAQSLAFNVYPVYVKTTNTNVIQASQSFTLPTGKGCIIEVRWIRRETSNYHTGGGLTAFNLDSTNVVQCTGGYISTSYATTSDIQVYYNTPVGTFYVQVKGPDTNTWDWQLIISINLC